MDNRAQISLGISRVFLALIVGAVMVWIVQLSTEKILSGATTATSHTGANQATTWFQQGIEYLPLAFLLISFFGIIVLAVFRRGVAG